ncbi:MULTISPECIES: sensor histidine kinase [unclassified Meiothermus]|uniref:sensor histidine kinase n=1 Tax=unclassified Meiothermus TaxID=370471 RepID=UPI000D7CEBD6|nr:MULTISPECIES: sensor histidine kinase [unclassified Meiothermus]PZA05917.1 sensor histidine kinase [Meiothermus sp. Pnk-1]RYM39398.1 sensor histidine kinase [Meiothermus sp. PNK-Is4]
MDRLRQTPTDAGAPRRDLRAYFSLAYLFLGLIPLLYPGSTWLNWVGSLVAAGVFASVYLRAFPARGRALVGYILLMALLGLLTLPFNAWLTGTFIISAAGRAAELEPISLARRMIACLLMVCTGAALFTAPNWWGRIITLLLWVFFCILAWLTGLYMVERQRYARRLEQAREENQRLAVIAERERIARDLHDVLGHTLSLIVLKAELARKLSEKAPDRAAREMAEVERIAREALAQVREVVRGYRGGLADELKQAKAALESAGIQVHMPEALPALPPTYEGGLALVLREAVTNVIRHSGASRVAIRLEALPEGVRLSVEDNGRGLRAGAEGSGILGMRQRVDALGGTLLFGDGPGTCLRVVLPPTERREKVGA